MDDKLVEFFDRIPLAARIKLKNELDASTIGYREWFIDKIGTYSTFEELQEKYTTEIEDSRSQEIFLINSDGIGTGEIWVAWLIKGALISGGNETFDITLNGNKYELKAYNFSRHWKTKEWQLANYNGPWRLGNAGAMTNFSFVDNLIYNAHLAHKVLNCTIDDQCIKNMQKVVSKIEKLSENHTMVGDFARGEVSQKKMKLMIEFINLANSYVNRNRTEYDIVNFASTTPGNPDVAYVIEQQSIDDLAKGTFKIIRSIDLHDCSDPIVFDRMLTKSRYIRDGIEVMIDDINSDISKVEEKYSNVKFVVFRKDSINITGNLLKIEDRTLNGLLEAVGSTFNLSSASVRVKENI